MLRISVQGSGHETTFKLEGKLTGAWVGELDRAWRAVLADPGEHAISVDMTQVGYVDAAGKSLLCEMHRKGARFTAAGPMLRQMIEEIGSRTLSAVLVIGLALLGARPASAQPTAGQPLRLTLRDAVQMALQQNPQVQIANLNVAQSQQDTTIARAALLPQGTLSTFERVQRVNLQASIGLSFPGLPQHVGPFETFQSGPVFAAPVFDLTAWRRWRATGENVRGQQAQVGGVREQIVALVVSQYLGSLRAAANVEASRSRVKLAEALFNQASDLQNAGVGTGIDTLRSNVELQNERQRLIESEAQLTSSLYGLARLLNLSQDRTVELSDQRSFFETPAALEDATVERALANRPEMRVLASRELSLRFQKQAASAARWPRVGVQGFWAYQGVSALTVIPVYTYQINVDVPIYTGGRIGAEVARAELELKKVAQQRQDTKNQIVFEVKNAVVQLESARHQVEVANLGVDLATQEVSQARDRFQAGVANNIEVISAQDALSRASDNQIVALYRYNQSRADLARAVGQIENVFAK